MYSYIQLDLNQLLDVGVDLWFPICPSDPNTGEIVPKFAVYIDISQRMNGEREAVIETASWSLGALEANVVMWNHFI